MTVENLKTIINLVFIQVISGWKWTLPGLLDKKTEDEEAAKEKKERGLSPDGDLIQELASQISSYIWPSVFFLQFSISPSLSSVGDTLRTSLQDELIHYFPINRLRWIEHLDSLFKMLVRLEHLQVLCGTQGGSSETGWKEPGRHHHVILWHKEQKTQ